MQNRKERLMEKVIPGPGGIRPENVIQSSLTYKSDEI